ncbi:MAG: hypothetical protein IJ127_29105 [Afipia sp.]|jgi:uncharacterized membrane protein|nr:hypothetical protein [Afipia sp.]MBS4003733.1 hypothetical protein [Afipia sp.]WIG53836.1 MAG: hypothetical protein OJF48_004757 [Afipia sp.]
MKGIRRLVIKTAEVMMVILVIVTILAGGIVGAASFGPTQGPELRLIGFGLGALAGLISSATVASLFFLVLEIAENTRRMLRYYEPDLGRY